MPSDNTINPVEMQRRIQEQEREQFFGERGATGAARPLDTLREILDAACSQQAGNPKLHAMIKEDVGQMIDAAESFSSPETARDAFMVTLALMHATWFRAFAANEDGAEAEAAHGGG